jgi:hypothetical protein
VNNVAAQPNHFIFVMETSLCAKPNPRKKVAGKRCWRFAHRRWPSATANYREEFGSRSLRCGETRPDGVYTGRAF